MPDATPRPLTAPTVAELEEVLTEFHLTVIADTSRLMVPGTVADPRDVADALHRHLDARAARLGDPGPAVPQFAAQPSLRARVMQIAGGLRRDADGIDADPHLSPLTRHADAEARRTAAARLDMAVTEDRATAPRPLINAFEESLRTMRRHAGAAGPSRKDKVRAAVAESERLIREAMDSD